MFASFQASECITSNPNPYDVTYSFNREIVIFDAHIYIVLMIKGYQNEEV